MRFPCLGPSAASQILQDGAIGALVALAALHQFFQCLPHGLQFVDFALQLLHVRLRQRNARAAVDTAGASV